MDIPTNRRPSVDTSQWGSFGGFQWEGPGIFENDMRRSSISNPTNILPPPPEVLVEDSPFSNNTNNNNQRRSSLVYDNSILSVPMLPGVSVEPIYRQQRSLSFSVGQDPTIFGYDDYEESSGSATATATTGINNNVNTSAATYGYKSSLATTMEEEEDDDDILQDNIDQQLSAARWRSRSQSSGAAFGLLSPSQHAALLSRHLRRGSEQHDDLIQQRRRSSRFFADNTIATAGGVNNPNSTSTTTVSTQPIYSQMSMGDKERLELFQRRLSQSHANEYKFPDQRYCVKK